MTDSSAAGRNPGLFSPERILFVLPILMGVGAGALLVMLGLLPVLVTLQQVRDEVELMELKQIGLPALRDRLRGLQADLKDKQEQQSRLVGLVAGPNQLKTLLASLNALTVAAGVEVTAVESRPVVPYAPPLPEPDPAAVASGDQPPAPPMDPLLRPGLERRSVLISLQGPYPSLLTFLRQLEALDVITLTDELTLLNMGQIDEPTQLTLSLSAYGRR